MNLQKYFTPEEIEFIQQYAQQHQLKPMEAVIQLAREMIQSYQLKFVSGQQVLSMLDLLAVKLPQWYAMQTNLIGQSAIHVSTLSKQLASLTQPSTIDKVMELLKETDIGKLLQGVLPLLGTMKKEEEEETDDNGDKGGESWL